MRSCTVQQFSHGGCAPILFFSLGTIDVSNSQPALKPPLQPSVLNFFNFPGAAFCTSASRFIYCTSARSNAVANGLACAGELIMLKQKTAVATRSYRVKFIRLKRTKHSPSPKNSISLHEAAKTITQCAPHVISTLVLTPAPGFLANYSV